MRALGDGVFDYVEEVAVVGGPGGGGYAFGAEGKKCAAAEFLDLEGVLAEAGGVGGIGKEMVVVGDVERAEAEEGMAFGEGIQVEEDLVSGARVVGVAKMEGVLLAFDGLGGIEIAAEAVRYGEVGLLDAGEHFMVEGFLKCLGGLEDGVGIGVFRLEMADDFGIFFFAEPGVVINAEVSVNLVLDRTAGRDRRLGRGILSGSANSDVVFLNVLEFHFL
jgi:hypothetical protein